MQWREPCGLLLFIYQRYTSMNTHYDSEIGVWERKCVYLYTWLHACVCVYHGIEFHSVLWFEKRKVIAESLTDCNCRYNPGIEKCQFGLGIMV